MASTSGREDDANNITVSCGDLVATYLVKENRVLYDGQLISPTEFEKLGGRVAAKKWKQSLRVVVDGEDRGTIGAWFILHGINNELFKAFSRPERQGPKFLGVGRKLPETTAAELIAHVEKQHIGFRVGDATVAELPETCAVDPTLIEVDLREMPEHELDALCAASCQDPFRDMLSTQPGVLENKLAHFTGFEAKRKPGAYIDDAMRVSSDFVAYLEGTGNLPEGARVPVVAGKPLNLQKLWQEVQAIGGYQHCTNYNLWAKIVRALNIDTSISTNASYLLRTIYQKLLFDKEMKIKIEQRGSPSAALPGIEPKIESAQEEELQFSRTEAKKQRVSSSPSADAGNIDLTHSEDQESAQRPEGLLSQFER